MPQKTIKGSKILFDEIDRDLVESHAWYITGTGYVQTKIKRPDGSRRSIGMHRMILGDPVGLHSDHINRNRLDNRRRNLRIVTRSENNRNRPTAKNKTSKYRGVSLRGNRWQVVVRILGKVTWLGSFDNEEDAAKVAEPYFLDVAP